MSMSSKSLGIRLRQARRNAGLSQKELARQSGFDQGMISRLENGQYTGNTNHIQTFAKLLNVSPGILFGENTEEGQNVFSQQLPARERILASKKFPPGLRHLAEEQALIDALSITDEEFESLISIQTKSQIDKEGYTQLLLTLRSVIH